MRRAINECCCQDKSSRPYVQSVGERPVDKSRAPSITSRFSIPLLLIDNCAIDAITSQFCSGLGIFLVGGLFAASLEMHAALLALALLATSSQLVSSSVFVADMAMTRMIELNSNAPFCALYHDRGTIQNVVLNSDPKKVRQISNNLVADLEETCKLSRSKGKNQPSGGIMYPGTKWCGPGNTAKTYDDLGVHAAEDSCCREHDHCPVTINPQQCIHGICNTSPITRSHCDCDAKFRRCLQVINTEVANTIGALFFNVIQVTCFKERRPCSQWQSCQGYEWQRSQRYILPKQWQPRTIARKPLNLRTIFQSFNDWIQQLIARQSPRVQY